MGFEGEQAKPIEPDGEQMTEEQGDNEQRRCHEPPRPRALAQRNPDRERPECKPDSEYVVHQADQQHLVVDDDGRGERHHRPASEQRAAQRKRAADNQDKRGEREHLPGAIDAHEPVQDRNYQVHHQVRDDPPLDGVEALQVGIRVDGRYHVRACERVEIIGERRQRVGGESGPRDGQRHPKEQHHDCRWTDTSLIARRPPEGGAESNRLTGRYVVESPLPLAIPPAKRHRRA